MTSLSKQLESLRTATAKQLTVEKKHVSLLFDRKEAEKLDRETIYKIALTGFGLLKKLDNEFFDDCEEFFEESVLNFQRTMITKEENEVLNGKLERLIYKLSPYFQHFSCQQVLEWLINRYQIHAFNAEFLIVTFLPYHDTNVFGRLISILEFNFSVSKDWGFLGEFAKKKLAVPFRIIVKNALSSKHTLLHRISDHIEKGVTIIGPDFLETKLHIIFIFFAKIIVTVLDTAKTKDDSLISKIIPILGNGLRSSICSFRNASLMITCQLCRTVKLSPVIVASITKILLMKLKASTLLSSLSTLVVICQHQTVENFSQKAIIKVIRKAEELGVWKAVKSLSSQTDLLPFYEPLWTAIFSVILDENTSEEVRKEAYNGLQITSDAQTLDDEQTKNFLTQLISSFGMGLSLPPAMDRDVYSLCVRYPDKWEEIFVEWNVRDKMTLDKFVQTFKLENLIAFSDKALKKRHRRRSNSIRKSCSEQQSLKLTAVERAKEMAETSIYSKRRQFTGDPIRKATEYMCSNDFENLNWSLEVLSEKKNYFSNQLEEDIEEFTIKLIKYIKTRGISTDLLKSVLRNVVFRSEFILALLSRYELNGSQAKKPKGKSRTNVEKEFEDEQDTDYWKRVCFVLEVLVISNKIPVDSALFNFLFDLLKETEVVQNGPPQHNIQHHIISLLTHMISMAGSYKVTAKDLQVETIVEIMRNTTSHHILRDSLKLLTAAVKINPEVVTGHIMSVFTFMGSGLLRKDNDLTLCIIERTLEALFAAVVQNSNTSKEETSQRLIAVSKVFASSSSDIPAHRRAPIAKALSKAIDVRYVWIVACVMVEGFCAKWQRSDPTKKQSDQDAFEDIVLELCADLSTTNQLMVVLDLIEYVCRIGGDANYNPKPSSIDIIIFDRSKFTIQKLRHFRFVIIGIAVKILSSKPLLATLSSYSNEELYISMIPISKRLLTASVDLDEFVQKENHYAEESDDHQRIRYWVAVQSRSDSVSEKLRYLLPGGVAAKLISDVLETENADIKIREKILQLANVKLLTDGCFFSDSGINEEHLARLAGVLKKFIAPWRNHLDQIELCKNAAFTLRLIAKRFPKTSESTILTEVMEDSVDMIRKWQTLDESMVGNVLLLAGELIRSHNMRSTMLLCEPLLKICLAIIVETISVNRALPHSDSSGSQTRRQRVRQQSLSGRKLGNDVLLIAALTCLQRILCQFAAFVSNDMGDVLVVYCRLMARYAHLDAQNAPVKGTVQHRLLLIKDALSKMEFRTLPNHLAYAVNTLVSHMKPLCTLFSLINGFFISANRSNVVSLRLTLLKDVFYPAFEYRTTVRKPEAFESIVDVEKHVSNALLKMMDLLTGSQVQDIISDFVRWAQPIENAPKSLRIRLISLFHFANELYSYFNQLAMPYISQILELAPKVLAGCNATNISDSSLLYFEGKRETIEGLETDFILRQIIIFIGNCCRHKEFLTQELIYNLGSSLVEEFVNTRVAGHESRCIPHLADSLYRVFDASSDYFPDLLNKVMLKTRSNKPKIRFRTLLVIEALVERIGDGLTPHLPMIMPFLSELLEDENKKVEEQCDRVVNLLQKKFGGNISEGFA